MKITIESTPTIVEIDDSVRARRWEGATESGTPIATFVAGLVPQTTDERELAQFAAELQERPPPETPSFERTHQDTRCDFSRAASPPAADLERLYQQSRPAALARAHRLPAEGPGRRDADAVSRGVR
jgi:hypothetical protein